MTLSTSREHPTPPECLELRLSNIYWIVFQTQKLIRKRQLSACNVLTYKYVTNFTVIATSLKYVFYDLKEGRRIFILKVNTRALVLEVILKRMAINILWLYELIKKSSYFFLLKVISILLPLHFFTSSFVASVLLRWL